MNNDSGVIDKVLLSCIATLLFSDAIAQPASIGCSSRVWVFPTSILQSKISRCIYVCIACGCYETSQRASQIWKSFCNRDRPFSSSTWSGRLFFCTKIFEFATAASRASWCQLTSFESDFSNPTSKTLVGLRQNPIFSTQTVPTAYLNRRWIRKFLVKKNRFQKIVVDSFNIAQNRNYHFRFWRQKAEVSPPKKSNNFMVCSIQSRSQEPDLPSPVFSLKTGPDTS